MVSDATRQRLRELAIAQGLGGNKYGNRRRYENFEIIDLYNQYLSNENKLKSLFRDKIFSSENKWYNDLARHFDTDSRIRFLVLLHPKNCKICDTPITLENYVLVVFRPGRHCRKCTDTRAWLRATDKNAEERKQRGENITKSKLKFYQSLDGERVRKLIGEKNSLHMSAYMKTPQGIERKEKSRIHNSKIMKENINQGVFTPCITNSWTHWNAQIILDDVTYKFRSSWEACFWMCNQHLQYESFHIPYVINGKTRTYIADFYDKTSNTIYELKPISVYNQQIEKLLKIIDFCKNSNINFVWINENNIFDWIDETKFNDINKPQLEKLNKARNGKVGNS